MHLSTTSGLDNLVNEINAILDICSDYVEFFCIAHSDDIDWVEMVCNIMSSHRVGVKNKNAQTKAIAIMDRQLELKETYQARVKTFSTFQTNKP